MTDELTRALLNAIIAANPETLTPWLDGELAGLSPSDKSRFLQGLAMARPLADALASNGNGATEAPPRFKVYTAADAFAPQPPIDWIITGLFSAGSVSLLVGDPGSGKTYALLNAAACVATGQDWLGHGVAQSPVLIVDEESGERRMGRRLTEAFSGAVANPDPNNLPFFYTSLDRFDPRKTDDLADMEGLINDTGAKFVIIDTLAAIMPGADENAVKDVQPVFMGLRSLAETTGAAIVLIHHSNKMGGYRGSSAMNGAVDLLLMVQRNKDSQLMTFKSEKARDVEAFEFTAETFRDPDTGRFWLALSDKPATAVHYSKAEAYVLRYLGEHGGEASMDDIKKHADACSEESARKAVYSLADKELVERLDGGGSGQAATYRLKAKATSEEVPF